MTPALPRSPRRWCLGVPLLLALACDSTGPFHRGGSLYAVLQATTSFRDSTTGLTSACQLSGIWQLPRWPDAATSTTTAFHLDRYLSNDTAVTLLRDTLVNGVPVTLSRVDSASLTLELGAPFNTIATVTFDSSGTQVAGTWPCPASFPLAGDTTLLNHGYLVDSIPPGPIQVRQQVPVD